MTTLALPSPVWRAVACPPSTRRIPVDNAGARLNTLMDEVAAGDRDAFARVYDLTAGAVFGTIRRILRDPSMAEEVTHDVMVEVWSKAPTWDRSRGGASTWILTMARRRAIDRVRSEQARRERNQRVAAASVDPPFDTVTHEVMRRNDISRVAGVLDLLTGPQRQAIELAFYDGKTHAEIAETLDVPLGTVKTRIRDGLLRLKSGLGGDR